MLQKSREKILEEMSRHPRYPAEGQSDLGTFVVPSPDGDSEAGRGEVVGCRLWDIKPISF